MTLVIRDGRLPDDLVTLTELLHRAYAELAAAGLQFVAATQSLEITERRARAGWCFVAECGGALAGTIVVRRGKPTATVPAYRDEGVFVLGQFGVDPAFRGRGVGRALHDHAVRLAAAKGARALALDTSVEATRLRELYRRWGDREIARHRWDVTNDESVVFRRELAAPPDDAG